MPVNHSRARDAVDVSSDFGPALDARADPPQVIERVNPCVVPVAPIDADGVTAHLLDIEHPQRGGVHLEGAGRLRRGVITFLGSRAVRSRASGAGAFVAQIREGILAVVAVQPVDLDSFGFGYGNMFR